MRHIHPRRVAHPKHGQKYHEVNSKRGVLKAARRLYRWIDLDCRVTKDGVLVITHWPKPWVMDGFNRPEGIAARDTVETLTWKQIKKLRTKDNYRIWRADKLVPFAVEEGLRVELELKSDNITATQLKALRKKLPKKTWVQAKRLGTLGGRELLNAKRAGYKTILLGGGKRRPTPTVPRSWQEFIDYQRGRVNWR